MTRKLLPQDFAVIGIAIAVVAGAYFTWGWKGVALAVGAGLMWALLHFTRLMHTLRRASQRPKGWVSSAVMLQSRLQIGMPMMRVVQLTGAFGDLMSPEDPNTQLEIWRWVDDGGDAVEAQFRGGKVTGFELRRKSEAPLPEPAEEVAAASPGSPQTNTAT
jgi:hypothetical protein